MRHRGYFEVAGIILAIIVFAIILFPDVFSGAFGRRMQMIRSQVHGFVNDAEGNRCPEAYARMSETYRAQVAAEAFCEVVMSDPHLDRARQVDFRESSRLDDTIRVTCVIRTDTESVRAVFTLMQREDRCWITGLTIEGLPAVPVPGIDGRQPPN